MIIRFALSRLNFETISQSLKICHAPFNLEDFFCKNAFMPSNLIPAEEEEGGRIPASVVSCRIRLRNDTGR